MAEFNLPTIITFVVYLLVMVAIGVWVYRRTKDFSDFALGGRQLSPFTASLSAQASDMSGWLLIGLPGTIYLSGLGAAWIAIGLAIGTYINWLIVAPRLRTYTERASNAVSLSAYFENRFEDRTRLLRIVSAAVIVVFFTVYVSSGLVAGGLLFETVFDIPSVTAISVAMVVIVAYTFLGGFLAVSFTDVIQGSMMFLALLIVPLVGISALGGFGEWKQGVDAKSTGLLDLFADVPKDSEWTLAGPLGWVAIVSGLAWGLGYFGQPHILARFMGIRSARDIPVARRIATGWVTVALGGACLTALVGIALIEEPLKGAESETVFIVLIQQLTNPWVAGLLLAAILAAVMSTVDSQLIVSSTALTEDFYRAFFHKEASQRRLMWIGRFAVVGVAVVAFIIALFAVNDPNPAEGPVLSIVAHAWAGFGASFGSVILLSLFWSRMSWIGALAGMVTGAVTALSWPTLDENVFGTGLYEMVPGFGLALIATVVFGHFGPRPQREWSGKYEDYEPAEAET